MNQIKELLRTYTIEVSEIRESDIEQMKPILATHVRDRNTHKFYGVRFQKFNHT